MHVLRCVVMPLPMLCPGVRWSCAQLCLDAGIDKLPSIGFMLTLCDRDTGVQIYIVQQELRTSHRAEQLVLLALGYKIWHGTKDTSYMTNSVQLALLLPTSFSLL